MYGNAYMCDYNNHLPLCLPATLLTMSRIFNVTEFCCWWSKQRRAFYNYKAKWQERVKISMEAITALTENFIHFGNFMCVLHAFFECIHSPKVTISWTTRIAISLHFLLAPHVSVPHIYLFRRGNFRIFNDYDCFPPKNVRYQCTPRTDGLFFPIIFLLNWEKQRNTQAT